MIKTCKHCKENFKESDRLRNVLSPIITVTNHNKISNGVYDGLKIVTLGQSAAKHPGDRLEVQRLTHTPLTYLDEGYEATRALASSDA